jgi:site-specific DNA recombinase
MTLRCAAYARYSSDLQSPTSIEDQLRKCREYAASHDFQFVDEHVYVDQALSGVGADRPGLGNLMAAAVSQPKPFDVILVDDSSRLSRITQDALTIFERLNFSGVRLIAVSQGIDSQDEQAHVLVTVHGMVDSLYVRELAKKTHRGLEGLVLKGRHAGGRVFGYNTIPADDGRGKTLVVDEAQAAVVRRIFQMSAAGFSLKKIATTLNQERVQPPRARAGRPNATWCPTAIREMLYRELYVGRVIWNSSRFIKVPGTNKRVRRARPQSEWRITQREDLRIIAPELWDTVQNRLTQLKNSYAAHQKPGLLLRSATSKYLFSGLLKCGQCGGNLVIVTHNGPGGQYRKYGCSQHFYRGACSNNLLERQDWLEKRLLDELQTQVLKPEAVEYAITEFSRQLKAALDNLSGELAEMRERKQRIETELRKLTDTAAQTGPSAFLVEAISDRERQLREITERLLSKEPGSIETHLSGIRQFVTKRLTNLQGLLSGETSLARAELKRHVGEIRMVPRYGEGRPHYLAEGAWDLLGIETGPSHNTAPLPIRMVAGVGFEPTTSGPEPHRGLQNNVSPTAHNSDAKGKIATRLVAGVGFEPTTSGL